MRISDWSSDVCSSDLAGVVADLSSFLAQPAINAVAARLMASRRSVFFIERFPDAKKARARRSRAILAAFPALAGRPRCPFRTQYDRKTVVSGTSVDVR